MAATAPGAAARNETAAARNEAAVALNETAVAPNEMAVVALSERAVGPSERVGVSNERAAAHYVAEQRLPRKSPQREKRQAQMQRSARMCVTQDAAPPARMPGRAHQYGWPGSGESIWTSLLRGLLPRFLSQHKNVFLRTNSRNCQAKSRP